MRKTLLAVAFAGLLAVGLIGYRAHAYELYLGVITSAGTSITNGTTGTPFTIPDGAPLAMQCDAAACVTVGLASAGTVTASCSATLGGVALSAGQLYDVPMVSKSNAAGVDTIAVISSSGTANCRVYRVITP